MNMNSRIYILAIALMTGVGAMAQNTQQNSNVEKIEKYTVQTNLFGDNLFVGANIGAQMYVGDYISKGKSRQTDYSDIRNQCRKMVYSSYRTESGIRRLPG